MNPRKIIGALEIGTSKVVALVGKVNTDNSLTIAGMGQSTTMGMKKGEIVDIKSVRDCTHAALMAAEKSSKITLSNIYLAATGRHLRGFANQGISQVSSSDNIVSKYDVLNATENAKNKELAPGRVYIHHMRSGIYLDGKDVKNPVGMKGDKLELPYWHVHGDEEVIAKMFQVTQGFDLHVDDLVVSSIASARMVTSETERHQGCLIVDIGSGTTDFVIYKNARIQRTGVIPVGGDHLTNDLALGLRINQRDADNIKMRYAEALQNENDNKLFKIGDLSIGDQAISKKAVRKIITARVEELFSILASRLSAYALHTLPGGVILTGGTSRLSGINDMASSVLKLPVRSGKNPSGLQMEELAGPEYSTVLGLLYYGMSYSRMEEPGRQRKRNWLDKVTGIFANK